MDLIFVIVFAVVCYAVSALNSNEEKRDYRRDESADGSGLTKSVKKSGALKEKAEALRRDLQAAVSEKETGTISAAEMKKFFSGGERKNKRPSPVEIKEYHEKRLDEEWEQNEKRNAHERTLNAKRFASARTKQSNADTVHAVHIDSCEGRLESLRVLYDAGILDREEYQQRVARVRAQHSESTR